MGRDAGTGAAFDNQTEILERVRAGERITDLASEFGYSNHAGIANRLKSNPEWSEAIIHGAWARLENRERGLEDANDKVSVSRADRLLNHARWWAERIDRDRFSPKPDISININNVVAIDGALSTAASSLLDQLRTVSVVPVAVQQIGDKPDDAS